MSISNMKIRHEYLGRELTSTVTEYIANALESDRNGATERANDTAENVAAALGRLVELLASRGVLNVNDIVNIARTYERVTPILLSDD